MKIYVAASWRTETQPEVVDALRANGHEVYDFRRRLQTFEIQLLVMLTQFMNMPVAFDRTGNNRGTI